MKKFVTVSALIAVVGLGVGIANRPDSPPQVVAASTPEATTITTEAAGPSSTTTTAPRTASKQATASTSRPASTPVTAPVVTTSTTRPATTTTNPATAIIGTPTSSTPTTRFKPACTLTVEKPTVAPGGDQVVRLVSNMPHVQAQIRFGTWVQTDSSGAASWQIKAPTTPGAISVTTAFMLAPGQFIGSVCSSSFTVAA